MIRQELMNSSVPATKRCIGSVQRCNGTVAATGRKWEKSASSRPVVVIVGEEIFDSAKGFRKMGVDK